MAKAVAVSAPPGLNKIFYTIIKQNGTYQDDRFRFIFYNLNNGKVKRVNKKKEKYGFVPTATLHGALFGYIVYYSVCQAICTTKD